MYTVFYKKKGKKETEVLYKMFSAKRKQDVKPMFTGVVGNDYTIIKIDDSSNREDTMKIYEELKEKYNKKEGN